MYQIDSNRSERLQRWQRRWFVLFDDGELTYALDEQVSFLEETTLPSCDRSRYRSQWKFLIIVFLRNVISSLTK